MVNFFVRLEVIAYCLLSIVDFKHSPKSQMHHPPALSAYHSRLLSQHPAFDLSKEIARKRSRRIPHIPRVALRHRQIKITPRNLNPQRHVIRLGLQLLAQRLQASRGRVSRAQRQALNHVAVVGGGEGGGLGG